MGANISIPCNCARPKIKVTQLTNKFMAQDHKVRKFIFSFLNYDKQIFEVILFNKILRNENGLKFFSAIEFIKIIKRIKKFSNILDFEVINEKIHKIYDYLKDKYSEDNLILAISFFILNQKHKYQENIPNDFYVNIKDNHFMTKVLEIFLKINLTLFSKKIFKIKIILNSDEKSSTKAIIENLKEYINEFNINILLDLIIPQEFCYSSLSSICQVEANFIINFLEIEKVSIYMYGLNMIEKKFEHKSQINTLVIRETCSLEGNERIDSEIYDQVNLDSLKNLIRLNHHTLEEISIHTYGFINLISDEFFEDLGSMKINNLVVNSKISKINVEGFKKLLLKSNFRKFNLDINLINKDDFLEIEILKILTKFIFHEKLVIYPLIMNFFMFPEFHKLNILSNAIKHDSGNLDLKFNDSIMKIFESVRDINDENSYFNNLKEIVNFISLNYIKSLNIYHNKNYSLFITQFICDLFQEMDNKKENDIQIEEFKLYIEDSSIENCYDRVIEYFVKSGFIKNFKICFNDYCTEKKDFNIVEINPQFKFEFFSYSSSNWVELINTIIENNGDSIIQFYFLVSNNHFNKIFLEFNSFLSDCLRSCRLLFQKFIFDTKNFTSLDKSYFADFLSLIRKFDYTQKFEVLNLEKYRIDTTHSTHTTHEARVTNFSSNSEDTKMDIFYWHELAKSCSSFAYLKVLKLDKSIILDIDMIKHFLENVKTIYLEKIDLKALEIKESNFDEFCHLISKEKFRNLKFLKLKMKDVFNSEKRALHFADVVCKNLRNLETITIFENSFSKFNDKLRGIISKKFSDLCVKFKTY
jgi:hypothetical protein